MKTVSKVAGTVILFGIAGFIGWQGLRSLPSLESHSVEGQITGEPSDALSIHGPIGVPDDPESLAERGEVKDVASLVGLIEREVNSEKKTWLSQVLATVSNPSSKEELLRQYLGHSDQEVVEGTRQALHSLADAKFVRDLVLSYRDVTNQKAERIVAFVGGISQPSVLPALEEIINEAGIEIADALSMASIRALANAGTPYATAALARRLEKAADEDEVLLLSLALTRIKRVGSDHELVHIAVGHQDASRITTRVAAIRALSQFPTPLAQKTLEKLAQDSDPSVAAAAQDSLAALAPR